MSPRLTARLPSAGKLGGGLVGAVDYLQAADVAIAQMLDDLLGDGARSDDERSVSLEIAIHALGEFHSGERNGHGPRADFGLRAHALAYFERSLKGAVENWASESAVERLAVGDLELAENFGFAEKHGIEAGGDAEEMANGVGAHPAVDTSRKIRARDAVIGGEEGLHLVGDC